MPNCLHSCPTQVNSFAKLSSPSQSLHVLFSSPSSNHPATNRLDLLSHAYSFVTQSLSSLLPSCHHPATKRRLHLLSHAYNLFTWSVIYSLRRLHLLSHAHNLFTTSVTGALFVVFISYHMHTVSSLRQSLVLSSSSSSLIICIQSLHYVSHWCSLRRLHL